MRVITVLALLLVLASSAFALEQKAVQMREDFGTEPLYTTYMNYYYYIPCPTSSWFWNYTGWTPGDMLGVFFTIGDPSMGRVGAGCPPYLTSDPALAHTIEQFRVLDFAGYGTIYPGLFTVNFDIWCADERGCPVGPSLWNSGPKEFCAAGWNYVPVTPNLCVTKCKTVLNPPSYPRILLTATMTGTLATYPAWGLDNISTPVGLACAMHDNGCCPALYPRPMVSHYPVMHTGIYNSGGVAYCPPAWILNPGDTVGDVFGCIELAWRLYVTNTGPTANEPSTWGNIKSMYK
jgi:hypothetical protein